MLKTERKLNNMKCSIKTAEGKKQSGRHKQKERARATNDKQQQMQQILM